MKMKLSSILGVFLVLVGSLFILSIFGWFPYQIVEILISWQALIVAVGIVSLLYKSFFSAMLVILVGLFFFIPHIFSVYGLDMPISRGDLFSLFIACLLIIGGLSILFGYKRMVENWSGIFEYKRNRQGLPQISCLFGEMKHTVIEKPYKEAQVATAFGKMMVDMTRTTLPEGDSYLEANTLFGTTIILLPYHWTVSSNVQSFFGTLKDLREQKPNEGTKRLIIRGNTMFGDLEIRSAYVPEPTVYRTCDEKEAEESKEETIDSVSVKHNNQIHIITLEELQYIQADGDYVTLCTTKGKFLKEQTMKYFQNVLPSDQFIRIHRSYIVNSAEIKSVDCRGKEVYYVVLKDGTSLRTSTTGYQLLKESLGI